MQQSDLEDDRQPPGTYLPQCSPIAWMTGMQHHSWIFHRCLCLQSWKFSDWAIHSATGTLIVLIILNHLYLYNARKSGKVAHTVIPHIRSPRHWVISLRQDQDTQWDLISNHNPTLVNHKDKMMKLNYKEINIKNGERDGTLTLVRRSQSNCINF